MLYLSLVPMIYSIQRIHQNFFTKLNSWLPGMSFFLIKNNKLLRVRLICKLRYVLITRKTALRHRLWCYVSIFLSIYVYIYQFIYLSVYLSIYQAKRLRVLLRVITLCWVKYLSFRFLIEKINPTQIWYY